MPQLPELMIAPNGARRTKHDHPELPVTIPEIVECARQCHEAGADGIHAHVRDEQGRHVLDVGLYRELLQEMQHTLPQMTVQVTSEAAGIYQAPEQQAIIRELKPAYVSVAMREMLNDPVDQSALQQAQAFYHWALDEGVTVQHIIYSAGDVAEWFRRVEAGVIPLYQDSAQLLFVLGRYRQNMESQPDDLVPFVEALRAHRAEWSVDWAVCAFGVGETACLREAVKLGGKVRIGFENSLWHEDGGLARDNRERVERFLNALPLNV